LCSGSVQSATEAEKGARRLEVDGESCNNIIIIVYVFLVGGLEHEWIMCLYLGNVIIPTDELTPSFFRGVAKK